MRVACPADQPNGKEATMPLIPESLHKNILLIAFHYPPYNFGSGMLRTLKFSKYLPSFDWHPTVLTVDSKAYDTFDSDILNKYRNDKEIIRCFCFNAPKYFSIYGRYPAFLACPDNYSSWLLSGFFKGITAVKQRKIDVIFSTFPIPSAHVLGYLISLYTGKPWVADFRDPMVQPEEEYPREKIKRYVWKVIEKSTVHRAHYVLFTTDSARNYYISRYGKLYTEKFKVIQNGFDDDDLPEFAFQHPFLAKNDRQINIRHCGLIYPEERDPVPFFKALRLLKDRRVICPRSFIIELYGSGNTTIENRYQSIVDALGIDDIVHLKPRIPYEKILNKMCETDILLLFQGHGCDYQVPAKIYEYFAVGKPILALTASDSESARLIRENKAGFVADLRDVEGIATTLENMITTLQAGKSLPAITPKAAQKYSRRQQAAELASLLNTLV
jgi:glycosyltransferase involved in cell wall biosynthesis